MMGTTQNLTAPIAQDLPDDENYWRGRVEQMLAELSRMDERIAERQANIDRKTEETRVMLAELNLARLRKAKS